MSEEAGTGSARFSLRLKLSIGLILIIGIIFAGVNVSNILRNRSVRRSEALASAETVARLVAGALIDELGKTSDIRAVSVRDLVRTFLQVGLISNKKNRDLAYVVLVDADDEVVVGRARPELVTFPGGERIKDETKVLAEIAKRQGRLGGNMRYKRFPLKLRADAPVVGKLIVGTSLVRLERQIRRDLIINFAILGGALAVLVLYASFALSRLVIGPLRKVTNAMDAVQQGDLEHHLDITSRDEIGQLADSYNFMVSGLREQERLKDAFNRYVSKQVYEKFQAGEIDLSGEERQATILFTDIRSFTSVSEQMTPAEVVAMLNEYFDRMVDIVFKYDGFLNKFIGDALMAIYNVPLDQDQPELRAVRTAVEMIEALDHLNADREARGLFPIKIGVGINTGPVIAGNIGHQQRLEYTVIGDAVNLASRIESQTKVAGAKILISEYTYEPIKELLEASELPPVKVKGKEESVKLYAVTGFRE